MRCRDLLIAASVLTMTASAGLLTMAEASSSSDATAQGEALGAAGNAKAAQATQAPPSSYPGFQTANPPQTQLYHSGSSIEDQARAAAATSDAGATVTGQALSGPQFSFQSNDPMLTVGQQADAAGESLINRNYSGCQTIDQPASSSSAEFTCYANLAGGGTSQTCTRQLSTSCPANTPKLPAQMTLEGSASLPWQYASPYLSVGYTSGEPLQGNCTIIDKTIQFNLHLAQLADFKLIQAAFDDYLYIAVNGHVVYDGPLGGNMLDVVNGRVQYDSSGSTSNCELGRVWQENPNVDLKPYLVEGLNTLHVRIEVTGNGTGFMKFLADNMPDCSANDHWTQTCPSGFTPNAPGYYLEGSNCTDGPSTHMVDGVPQERACWTWQDQYVNGSAHLQEDSQCQAMRQQGCAQTSSTCVQPSSSGCTRYEETFACSSGSTKPQTTTICGSDLYCPGGNCAANLQNEPPGTAQQMAEASSFLQAAQDTATDNTNSTGVFSFFKGTGMSCGQSAVGFSNCCAAKGWGQTIGLDQCSTEEKQLGLARQAHRTHFIGTYTTGSFVLKVTHQSYCVFTSMLSRIIQEQGRKQLGISWGSPKSPNCRALTPEEMDRLDWNAMDFSEFYSYATAQAQSAMSQRQSNAAIQQQVQQQINYMSQHPGATAGTPSGTP
jgi:hypothetical protein